MINFMKKYCFSVEKLKLMCSGQQPQKFEQILYLDIVLRSLSQIKNKEKELSLLSSKNFYQIPQYFQLSNYTEINKELKNVQESNLKNIIETNAEELLKSKQNTLNSFINIIPILGKDFEIGKYSNLIEEQIKALLPDCREKKKCQTFSAISLIRFCKAMSYYLQQSDNESLKQYFQTFVFQILLNKQSLKLSQILQFLHNLQFVKYYQLVSSLPQKQLASEVSKQFLNLIHRQLDEEIEISAKPEFYSQLTSFLSKTSYFKLEDAEFIEKCIETRIKWKDIRSEYSYLQIYLGQLGKVGKGQYCVKRLLELHKQIEEQREFITYNLLNLLYYQARTLMEKFKQNPTRAHLEQLKKQTFETEPLIKQIVQKINSIGLQNLNLKQEKINQLKLCQVLLKCFNLELVDEEGLSQHQFQASNVATSRKNEVNVDLENFLNKNKVEFISDYTQELYQYDYYVPSTNTIIECDGSFHYVTGSYNIKDSSSLARDLIILDGNYKLMTINWFFQTESRFQKDKYQYIKQQWEKILNDDIIYVD